MKLHLALVMVCTVAVAHASATTIVSDDFESYADTAALGGTWSLTEGTLDSGLGNPGNSMNHPGTTPSFTGGNVNSVSFAAVVPGPGETLVFEADIYDDGTSANKRVTAGLRNTSAANLLEMGMYNSPAHYAIRAVNLDGISPSWVAFDNMVDDAGESIVNAPVAGWHTFRAEISTAGIVFTVDLNGDGNINGTFATSPPTSAGFNIIRLGGPSGFSSGGGGANFDNVSLILTEIPEPGSAVLLAGMVGLGILKRRK